jgi:hypothetical protein
MADSHERGVGTALREPPGEDLNTLSLVDRVAALVAAAEERGFDRGVREAGSGPALAAVRAEAEWRGAEKERERIVAELRREAHPWYDAQTRMLELADRWASS